MVPEMVVSVLVSMLVVAGMSCASGAAEWPTRISETTDREDETGCSTESSGFQKVIQDFDSLVAVSTTKESLPEGVCATITKAGDAECDSTSEALTQTYKYSFRYGDLPPFEGSTTIKAYPNGTFGLVPQEGSKGSQGSNYRLAESKGDCIIVEKVSSDGTASYQYVLVNADLPKDKMEECATSTENSKPLKICTE